MSWNQAQQQTWNDNTSEYSDEEENSDDEYAPIVAGSWGNQTVNQDGTTQISVTAGGWKDLIDPNIKLKAGGVGSGQLHRRGGNFKPLDEQLIINQRLGKPIPKALGGGRKKRGGGKPKPALVRRPPPSSMPPPPSSSAYRSREPLPNSGPWGSGNLASTPFWQQAASNAASGTSASKYASRPPPQQQQQWGTPAAAAPLPPQQQQWDISTAAAAPRPPQQQQCDIPTAAAAPRPPQPAPAFAHSATGSAASKYATGSAASRYATPAPAPTPAPVTQQWQQQPQQQYQIQQQSPVQEQAYEPPQINLKLGAPCLVVNIELAAGIKASFSIYVDDDTTEAVNRFEKNHQLEMSDFHKKRLSELVDLALVKYR